MRLSAARQAWLRWQAAAGPWRGWSVCPTLLAPELECISPVTPANHVIARAEGLAAELEDMLTDGGTLVYVDLEPTLGVYLAARLSELDLAHPLLVLPRWPYAQAVLPVGELLHALLSRAPRAHPSDLRNVCLVVDAERQQPLPGRSRLDERADNRYRLTPYDLPTLGALRARGIGRIVRLAQS